MKEKNHTNDMAKWQPAKTVEIDNKVMIPGIILLMLLCASFFFVDFSGSGRILNIRRFLTSHLGSIYLFYIFGVLILLTALAISKVGSIRLGEGPPQYSTPSWISMLFCACIGSSILYWGFLEWGYYVQAPPFGIEPFSADAAEISIGYTMFHWGISGWATYCLGAIIIAYYFFVKKIPIFRISVSCGLHEGSPRRRHLGRVVDIFVIIGLCAGIAVSIALGAPMLAYGLHELFGIEPTVEVNILIVVFWSVLFSWSALRGIDKGISILSNINCVIAILFTLFVLFCGNTNFIVNNTTNTFGLMLQNFLKMSFYTDPVRKSWFPQDWTVFYWTWWVSYIPVMGMFIAKISRGRTIRQAIVGMVSFGSLGCWFFQSILGGYGLDLLLSGKYDMIEALNTQGDYAGLMGVLKTLPMPKLVIGVFVILAFIFLATTSDSSAYILASLSSKELRLDQEPTKMSRLIWCMAIIVWPIVLLLVGGIDVIQLCSMIGSIPLLFIVAVMVRNFLRDVKKDVADLKQ